MIKQIQLRGISRSPSDRMTSDGGCSESLNVITDQTELAPMPMPEDITSEFGIPKAFSAEVLYIHKSGEMYRNVIVRSGSRVVAYSKDGVAQELYSGADDVRINDIKSLGNILLVIINGQMNYFLYVNGKYEETSGWDKLPNISFEPIVTRVYKQSSSVSATGSPANPDNLPDGESPAENAKKKALAKLRSLVPQDITTMFQKYMTGYKSGTYRILRFSLLMYDGKEIISDAVISRSADRKFSIVDAKATGNMSTSMVYTMTFTYNYSVNIVSPNIRVLLSKDSYAKINDGIIQGIRIYASQSFGGSSKFSADETELHFYINETEEYSLPYYNRYFLHDTDISEDIAKKDVRLIKTYLFNTTEKTDDIAPMSALLAGDEITFPNNDTLETLPEINFKLEYVPSIGSFSRMIIYNQKLIGVGNSSVPNVRNLPHSIVENTGTTINKYYSFTFEMVEPTTGKTDVVVAMDYSGSKWFSPASGKMLLGIVYFPSAKCRTVYITAHNGELISVRKRKYTMVEHPTMTGYSYALLDNTLSKDLWDILGDTSVGAAFTEVPKETQTEKGSQKLFVSELGNPFIFSAAGVFSFDDEILGVATTTKALSAGQFGQFPLYVFTKGGIWSMETAADGSFVSKKPLSRDVALSADCITQIEQAVVFTTDKGVMLLSGSDIKNISPFMTGKHYVLENQSAGMLGKSGTWSPLLPAVSDATPFMDFMRSAKCAYDYTGQRLLFFNDGEAYQYVYKFDTDTWHKMSLDIPPFEDHQYIRLAIGAYAPDLVDLTGLFGWFESHGTTMVRPIEEWTTEKMQMGGTYLIGYNDNEDNYNYLREYFDDGSPWNMQADLGGFNNTQKVSVLNSYPDCWVSLRVKDGGTKILNLSTAFDTDKVQPLKGIIVTRPFDLEEPDIRKAIRSIRIRGNFNRNDVKYILQASMDGIHWGVLPSLRAGSFKLFRLVLLCDLEAYERISYIDIDYETRFTNRLR